METEWIIFCLTCNKQLDTCKKGEDWAEEIARTHIYTREGFTKHNVLIGYQFKEKMPMIKNNVMQN